MTKKFFIINFIFLLLLSTSWTQAAQNFEQDIYEYMPEAHRVAQKITNQYPPKEYTYIGVGRSPTLLISFLNQMGHEAYNLPLSSFRQGQIDKDLLHRFESHIFEHLPLDSNKKLVFIDFASSGATLISVNMYFNALKKKRSNLPAHEFFVLAGEIGQDFKGHILRIGLHDSKYHVETYYDNESKASKIKPFFRALLQQKFDEYAEYKSFNLSDSKKRQPKFNSKYLELNSMVQKFLKTAKPKKRKCRGYLAG